MGPVKRVALIGAGAVGAVYAHLILKNCPAVQLFAVSSDKEKYFQRPVLVNDVPLSIEFKRPEEIEEPVDLLLIAVKNYNLEKTIADGRAAVGENTVMMPLLNGMTCEAELARVYGWDKLLFARVFGLDSHRVEHRVYVKHHGAIHFGELKNTELSPKVLAVRAFFQKARIAYEIPEDMERVLWKKLLINVGMNQVSTVMQLPYGQFRETPKAMELMRSAQQEVLAIARQLGVNLTEADIRSWEASLQTLSAQGRSSMLQDFWLNRKTEVENLGGFVIDQGKKLKIPTPVNEWLVAEILKIENEKK